MPGLVVLRFFGVIEIQMPYLIWLTGMVTVSMSSVFPIVMYGWSGGYEVG